MTSTVVQRRPWLEGPPWSVRLADLGVCKKKTLNPHTNLFWYTCTLWTTMISKTGWPGGVWKQPLHPHSNLFWYTCTTWTTMISKISWPVCANNPSTITSIYSDIRVHYQHHICITSDCSRLCSGPKGSLPARGLRQMEGLGGPQGVLRLCAACGGHLVEWSGR